jgi:hypothetical protein
MPHINNFINYGRILIENKNPIEYPLHSNQGQKR